LEGARSPWRDYTILDDETTLGCFGFLWAALDRRYVWKHRNYYGQQELSMAREFILLNISPPFDSIPKQHRRNPQK
jgi:hypothetical protein